ncbi:hypothetical protein [Algivirga pacifica]|uniref:WD40-like Beta Propeller Repeat n=1 Tax=Algivirga pacifica TaxID=1162670 RepID=A0ABP9DHH5_9BACT
MKWTSLALLLFVAFPAFSQKIQQLDVQGYYPKLSPDGKQVLLTSSKFTGLKLYDLAGKSTRSLTDKPGAGYGAEFNGDKIVFADKGTRQLMEVTTFSGKLSPLSAAKGEQPHHFLALKNKAIQNLNKAVDARPTSMLDGVIVTMANGEEKTFSPLGTREDYIWTSVSPDGQHILMKASGYTAVITDLNGNVVKDLGDLEAPKWLGNNRIIYMETEDNHDTYIKSDIYVLSLDNQKSQKLTEGFGKIAMYPDAQEGKVVFNTPEGEVFMIEY